MTPKRPSIESKKTLFLKNRQIFTPNRESRLASKNDPFFLCSSGCACVQDYYLTIIIGVNLHPA